MLYNDFYTMDDYFLVTRGYDNDWDEWNNDYTNNVESIETSYEQDCFIDYNY